MLTRSTVAALLLMAAAGAQATRVAPLPADPLRSPAWESRARALLDERPVVFDDRVQVTVPRFAEDPMNVPVHVQANGLKDVVRILVFADMNPIPAILEFQPMKAQAEIGFRFEVEQSTPVRAAVLTRDGRWHVGGTWLSAAGGGCTAPGAGASNPQWADQLGQVSGRVWPMSGGATRVKLRVMHPMDTGLAPRIPVFYMEHLSVRSANDEEVARITTWEPVSENPVFSLNLLNQHGTLKITGRDTQANTITGRLSLP